MPGQDFQNEHILRGYDPVSHSPVPVQVGTTATDPANNEVYAPLQVAGGTGGGGGADVQYTDGLAPPVSPIGNALVFDNAGIWNDVGADHPLPVTSTPPTNQRVSSLANDYATGAIVDLLSLLNVTGTAADANTINSLMGRLTKIRDLLNAALTVSVNNFPATQPISGTVTGNQGAPNTLANKWPVQVSDGTNTMPTGDAAARTIHTTVDNASLPVTGTFWQATQPVSGTITANEGGTWTVQPGNTPNTTPWLMQDVVAATGGEIPYHNLTAASTNFTNVKAVACQMYSCRLSNTSASTIFVKFYDKATAPATTDTPKSTIQVPATSVVPLTFPHGMKFVNGFGWGATGAVADADATAIAANCIVDFSLNS